jgi:hypothetical protein
MSSVASFKQTCPSCGGGITIKNLDLVGKKVDCPKCKYRFVVESPDGPGDEPEDRPEPAPARMKKDKKKSGGPSRPKGKRGRDEEEKAKPSKKGLFIMAGVGVAVLVIVGIVLIFTLGGGEDKNKQAKAPPPPPPAPPVQPQKEPDEKVRELLAKGDQAAREEALALLTDENQETADKAIGAFDEEMAKVANDHGSADEFIGKFGAGLDRGKMDKLRSAMDARIANRYGPRDLADEPTNMLPKDTQVVLSVFANRFINGPVGNAIFGRGAYKVSDFDQKLGFNAGSIDQLVIGSNKEHSTVLVVIRTGEPYDFAEVKKAFRIEGAAKKTQKGKEYWLGKVDFLVEFLDKRFPLAALKNQAAVYPKNPKTLLYGDEVTIQKYLDEPASFAAPAAAPASTPPAGGGAGAPGGYPGAPGAPDAAGGAGGRLGAGAGGGAAPAGAPGGAPGGYPGAPGGGGAPDPAGGGGRLGAGAGGGGGPPAGAGAPDPAGGAGRLGAGAGGGAGPGPQGGYPGAPAGFGPGGPGFPGRGGAGGAAPAARPEERYFLTLDNKLFRKLIEITVNKKQPVLLYADASKNPAPASTFYYFDRLPGPAQRAVEAMSMALHSDDKFILHLAALCKDKREAEPVKRDMQKILSDAAKAELRDMFGFEFQIMDAGEVQPGGGAGTGGFGPGFPGGPGAGYPGAPGGGGTLGTGAGGGASLPGVPGGGGAPAAPPGGGQLGAGGGGASLPGVPGGGPGGGRGFGPPGTGEGGEGTSRTAAESEASTMLLARQDEIVTLVITVRERGEQAFIDDKLGPRAAEIRAQTDMRSGRLRIGELAGSMRPYLSAKQDSFPPGALPRKPDPNRGLRPWPPSDRVSWMRELLPYLDNSYVTVYQDINPDKSWRDEENAKAGRYLISQFVNPNSGNYFTKVRGVNQRQAVTHFVGMAGVGPDAPYYAKNDPRAGIFGYDRNTTLADIKDGTSNTIYMIQVDSSVAGPWIAGGGATVRGTSEQGDDVGKRGGFLAPHLGKQGTWIIMADGSVRYVTKDISPDVFKAMCTMAGGEPKPDLNSVAPETKFASAPVAAPPPAAAKPEEKKAPAAKDEEKKAPAKPPAGDEEEKKKP